MSGISSAIRDAIVASAAPSRAIAQRWREGPEVRRLERAFAYCPLDEAGPAAALAERLFGDDAWAGELLVPLVAALAADPFFEPPLRVSRDALGTSALLYECPAVSIAASVVDAAALATSPAPATILFSGRVSVTRYVKAGAASLQRWSAEPITPAFTSASARPCVPLEPLSLSDGDVTRCDGRIEAQRAVDAGSAMVLLVATIHPGATPLMREYNAAEGTLARLASADDRPSRAEMLLAFLRLAGRADAGDRFDEATRDAAFHLRWAAMREWLALDARAALPRLEAMASGDPHAEVRAAATLTLVAVRRRIGDAACLA